MELKTLQHHIRSLVTLEETGAPVISCYLSLADDAPSWRMALDLRLKLLRRSLRGDARWDFEEAMGQIEAYLAQELKPDTQGVALFARGGEHPFFLPLQFQVPVPTWVVVNSTPNIYYLVELKDTYHRYVVMIATADTARILEVNLGAITEESWRARPELRKRVGREWTKEHYQSHRRARNDQFLKESIGVLDGLMRAGGYTYLILAGHPWETARIRQALPKRIAGRLVDTIPVSGDDRISDVVAATLSLFVEVEELESQAMADKLRQEIMRDGLAVAGMAATLHALRQNQVDLVLIAKDYGPERGWACQSCGAWDIGQAAPARCPVCAAAAIRSFDPREEMVRLAEQEGTPVEVVVHSDFLMQVGGVGALLRYRTAAAPLTLPRAA